MTKVYLTREEELELARKAKLGDTDARNRVVMNIYGLLVKAANKVSARTGKDFDELLQIGFEFAIKRFEGFDPEGGFRFSTYIVPFAAKWMQTNATIDGLIRLPYKYDKDKAAKVAGVGSLDFTDNDDQGIASIIADSRELLPEEGAEQNEQIDKLNTCLRCLNPTHASIVRRRMAGDTLDMIGSDMAITREWVRQIEKEAHLEIKRLMSVPNLRFVKFQTWTRIELEKLRQLIIDRPIRKVALLLGRGIGATYRQVEKHKFKGIWHARNWTPLDDQFLRDHRGEGWFWCAQQLKRPGFAVHNRARRLGIQNKMLSADELAIIRTLTADGLSTGDIGERLGVSGECVRVNQRRFELPSGQRNEQKRMRNLLATLKDRHGAASVAEVRTARRQKAVDGLGRPGLPPNAAVVAEAIRRIGEGDKRTISTEVKAIVQENGWKWTNGSRMFVWVGVQWLLKNGMASIVSGGGNVLLRYRLNQANRKDTNEQSPCPLTW